MTTGGKRLKDLIKRRGFRLGAVTDAIGVDPSTLGKWTDNAPIGKLVKLSEFTHIPLMEIIHSLVGDSPAIDTDPTQIDRPGAIESKVERMGDDEN